MRRVVLIPGVVLGAATMLGVAGFILPAWRSGQRTEAEIALMRAELARPTDGPEIITGLANRLQQMRTTSRERMVPIPETSDVAGLMTRLSAVLNKLGLTQREITTGAETTIDDTAALPMSVTLRGDFTSIHRAIAEIERLPRLVRVERVRMAYESRGAAESFQSDTIRADLLIDVFFGAKNEPMDEFVMAGEEREP